MMKSVVYNGGKETYHFCDDPSLLVEGKAYQVEDIDEGRFQTNYKLIGITGVFNSCWFNEQKDVYMAYTNKEIYIGAKLPIMRFMAGNWYGAVTSNIVEIQKIYGNVFKVETENSVYIVQQIKKYVK